MFRDIASLITGVIPKSLPVLSTEPVLRKAAVDQGLRFSTEQYECGKRNDFVKCTVRVLFYCMFFTFYIVWLQFVPEIVCYCLKFVRSLTNSLF